MTAGAGLLARRKAGHLFRSLQHRLRSGNSASIQVLIKDLLDTTEHLRLMQVDGRAES